MLYFKVWCRDRDNQKQILHSIQHLLQLLVGFLSKASLIGLQHVICAIAGQILDTITGCPPGLDAANTHLWSGPLFESSQSEYTFS